MEEKVIIIDEDENKNVRIEKKIHYVNSTAKAGVGFGSVLAMIISFQVNHSILWAILHGVLSWVYVIYRAIKGGY